ncbi:MAG: hypothetical protein Q9195_003743 [Heterodermia aff. obscurata]
MRKHARWAHSSVSAILGGATVSGGREVRPKSKDTKTKDRSERSLNVPNGALGIDDSLASRWGLRGKKGKSMQDNPLMSAFARLRNDIRGCTDIRTFDVPSLLHPFLQVIRSSSTSAPITSLALVAITKFFAYNLIGRKSPRLSLGMQLLSAAITHCRFEASDTAADETVLLRILKLMEDMLRGPGGDLLGDESVCEMMETGLSMCCQMRLSELLRRSAEMSMITMCQVVFERLKSLEAEVGENIEALDPESNGATHSLKMEPSIDGTNVVSLQNNKTQEQQSSASLEDSDRGQGENAERPPIDGESTRSLASASAIDLSQHSETNAEKDNAITPYSLPSIRELFRVLVDLLQPHNRQHADAMRVMALRIIDVALEVAGPSIARHPSLATLARNDLCRHLFQLVRSEHIGLLNESLRVAGTLLASCRGVLKLQQELFLSYLVACLHPRVEIPLEPGIDPALYEGVPQAPKLVKPSASQTSSGRSTPVPVKDRQKLGLEGGSRKPDAREAMVECLGALSRIPSFLVELYVNYDCEVDRSDLCEDLIGLLSRNAFPDSATWSTTNVPPLCLDSLLGYIQFIADRLHDKPRFEGYPDRQQLQSQRARKKVIVRGATKFNENPKAGIAFLASQGIIENPDDAHSVTSFLRGTTRISKGVLGDWLSKKSHGHLLQAFLDFFDFDGKRVDEALRELLNSFRLPGESQLIERIVTNFSEKYCASSTPEGVADQDAVFVLTYAIIMLNTDQHNPNMKGQKRMTYDEFAKNLRGVNGGKDFAPEYLHEIYDSIKTNEIILPDEHNNKQSFDYAWEELLLKARRTGPLVICDTNIFDADMFSATWKPTIATLSYVFMSASDDAVFSRVVAGFDQCAQIAAKYNLTDALDHILFCLSSITTLASPDTSSTALNTEVQVGKKSVMVSELAVRFGRDFKAQLASVVLFGVISGKESKIKSGWKLVVRIWLNLFVNSLIPSTFSKAHEILDIPEIPLQTPAQVIDRAENTNESGLFQSLTSYLSSYAADDPPEPSEEELESTLCTVDCINACAMSAVFSGVLQMPAHSLQNLVSALLEQLPEKTSPVVITVKPERPAANSARTNGYRTTSQGPVYDPAIVFVLELATVLAMRDAESTATVGQAVADALYTVVRDAANVHPLLLSRAVYYLLLLLNASQDHSFIRAPVILHTISSFHQSVLDNAAITIIKGLALCIQERSPLRNEMINTPDFWSLLQSLKGHSEVAPNVFELISRAVTSQPSSVTADNYEATVSLLDSFATAGSVGAVIEQKKDRNARRSKPTKASKPRSEHLCHSRSECRLLISMFFRESEFIDRGFKAVTMIYQLADRVPSLIEQSHLERNEAWITYWSPIFQALRAQCLNPCREIRHQAFTCLQRSLLFPDLASPDHQEWTAIFGEVLFPLISRLLKPEIYQSDPVGMGETRVQAATLLCKIFLHHLVLLSEWDGMLDVWLKVLDIMDRLMDSGQGDILVSISKVFISLTMSLRMI